MENPIPQNQSEPQPVEVPASPSGESRLLQFAMLGLLALLPVVGFGAYQLGKKSVQSSPLSNAAATPMIAVSPVPSQEPSETMSQNQMRAAENKKLSSPTMRYADATYSFNYPADWTVKPGLKIQEEQYFMGDVVSIVTPKQTVSVDITPMQGPYGFGPVNMTEGETITITVNGKNFSAKELIRTEQGIKKVYVDMPVPIGGKEYYIRFGTGYPVNDDGKASYSDYLEYRDALVETLSTLTIAE